MRSGAGKRLRIGARWTCSTTTCPAWRAAGHDRVGLRGGRAAREAAKLADALGPRLERRDAAPDELLDRVGGARGQGLLDGA